MNVVRPLLRTEALRNFAKRSYHPPANFKPATMNDLPQPSGSWKTDYDARNAKYNVLLLVGVAFFTVTCITAKASGAVYLNYYPPKSID